MLLAQDVADVDGLSTFLGALLLRAFIGGLAFVAAFAFGAMMCGDM